jgi:hypothetical protein
MYERQTSFLRLVFIDVMMTIELKYPLNKEVKEFDLPLPPVFIDGGDYAALLFSDEREYFAYMETLCDLIDSLYYEAAKTEQTRNKLTCLTNHVFPL